MSHPSSDSQADASSPSVPTAANMQFSVPFYPGAPWLPRYKGEPHTLKDFSKKLLALFLFYPLSPEQQVQILLSQLEGAASREVRSWPPSKKDTPENILAKLKDTFEVASVSEVKMRFFARRQQPGQSLDPDKKLMDAFSNVLCAVMFGDRFEYKDERFIRFLKLAEESFRLASSPWGQLQSILPTIMNYVPGPHHRMISISEELADFIHERIKASMETLDPTSPRHFIDSFLIKMEEEKNNPNTEFNLKNLLVSTHNLFLAGIETVSTTLRYGLLILLKYPEIQAKIHKEIDQVIGQDRAPNYEDRMEMHYTQAVMQEIHRFSDVLPLNLPHMVTRDVQFRGYQIPKGTEIYPLLCTVHRDPKQFSSPWTFDPNRFLDETGKFKKNDAVMPFSVGKRICPGEVLARMELFIFLTTILQNFKLTSMTKFSESDIAPKLAGFLNAPISYELSFLPREI